MQSFIDLCGKEADPHSLHSWEKSLGDPSVLSFPLTISLHILEKYGTWGNLHCLPTMKVAPKQSNILI